MRYWLIAILFLAFSAQEVHAKSHSKSARLNTLAELTREVDRECGGYFSSWQLRCRELRSLVSELYRNPEVATKDDLLLLEKMEKLGLEVRGAQTDLALAIAKAKVVYAHVVNDHKGVWEPDMCLPTTAS